MNYISDILYWISTGLLVPVIVLLIFFFGRALLLIGGFFGQYMAIRRTAALLSKELDGLNRSNVATLSERLPKKGPSLVVTYMKRLLKADSAAMRQRLLADFEIGADKDLATSKTLGKMGPMLGLMGTLIPMGPALVGLSTGDIASMAYNMQVAFATTVVGLFAAAIGFITGQVKQRWYLKDMTDLEFVAELLNENGPGHETQTIEKGGGQRPDERCEQPLRCGHGVRRGAHGGAREPLQHDGDVQQGGLHDGEEPRQGEYGDYNQGGRKDQSLHPLRRPK